jgi:hypothetical protein
MGAEISVDGSNWVLLPATLIFPSAANLREIQADLSSYAGQLVEIRFSLLTDELFVADGVYIDDIEITEVGVFNYDGTQYKHQNGTSFSAPLVAGVAAMIMAQRPDLTHQQVRQFILENVDVTTELSGQVATGERLNARTALASAIMAPDTTTVDLSGTIKTTSGQNICAMVLASGKYTFSCDPVGVFSLTDLPRENNGTVKRQVYADGFFPKIDILTSSSNDAVVMTRSGVCPSYNIHYDPAFMPGSAGKRINISG